LIGPKKFVTKHATIRQVERRLEIHGFEMLGDGASGSVWSHPQVSYVLKLFMISDVSYLEYVKMVINGAANPHFPRFRGRPIQLTSKVYAIRMEKLSPWRDNSASVLDRAIHTIMDVLYEGVNWRKQLQLRDSETQRAVSIAFAKWPHLESALDRLVSFEQSHSDAAWDLHEENIMKRGSVPVFTDPFTW
jgi:hypothetical protein